MNNNTVSVSLSEFYSLYPEFNTENYTSICPACFNRAQCYFSTQNMGRLQNCNRKSTIYLMTAHLSLLTYRNQSGAGGAASGLVASAAVGEVNVSYVQIPNLDKWEYWLSLTPYGLELLALLDRLTAIGFYFGGSLERVFN